MPWWLTHAADDDVGAVPEHPGPEDVEGRARDRDDRDDDEHDPHRPEHAAQAPERVLEVLRALAGNARRVPPAGGARLGRREVELLVFFVLVIVDERHAALFSPICDWTISAYVGQSRISSSCVPRPMTTPSSSTRMLSAVEMVDTRCATMTTAASFVYGPSAARSRASVARSRAENESSNT